MFLDDLADIKSKMLKEEAKLKEQKDVEDKFKQLQDEFKDYMKDFMPSK